MDPSPDAAAPAPFRVGITPGVTVTTWARVWAERRPGVPLEVVPLDDGHVPALHDGALDVAFVRLPVAAEGLHVIPLWSEVPVVVAPKDHPVALFDELTVADLADEDLLNDPDEVPGWREAALAAGRDALRPPPEATTAADAVALVAAGLGVLVLPMAVARLHARKDLVHRPVVDLPTTRIALAWPAERTTDLVEDFVGIVRGRTARSSRGTTEPTSELPAASKAASTAGSKARSKGAAGSRGGRSGQQHSGQGRGASGRATGRGARRGRRR